MDRPNHRGRGHQACDHGHSLAKADVGVAALEYSGLSAAAGTGAVDQTAQNTGTTSSAATVSSGATPATTAGGELAIGFYVDSGFGDTLTAGSGFTSRTNVSKASDIELLVEDRARGPGSNAERRCRHGREHHVADVHDRLQAQLSRPGRARARGRAQRQIRLADGAQPRCRGFDEFAIASFLGPPGSPTYPVFLYTGARTPALLPQVIAIVVAAEVLRRWAETRTEALPHAAR